MTSSLIPRKQSEGLNDRALGISYEVIRTGDTVRILAVPPSRSQFFKCGQEYRVIKGNSEKPAKDENGVLTLPSAEVILINERGQKAVFAPYLVIRTVRGGNR